MVSLNTEVNAGRVFTFTGNEWLLSCPLCRCRFTHVQKAYALEGCDEFEGGSIYGELYGVPVGGLTEYRRGCLVVEVWGECSHTFQLRFQQHKGETFIQAKMEAAQ